MPENTFGRRPMLVHSPREDETEHVPPSSTIASSRLTVSPCTRSPGLSLRLLNARNSNPYVSRYVTFPGCTRNCIASSPPAARRTRARDHTSLQHIVALASRQFAETVGDGSNLHATENRIRFRFEAGGQRKRRREDSADVS